MAFAPALHISIRANLIEQDFSHLNCPLACFTIIISWDFLLRCESRAWRNCQLALFLRSVRGGHASDGIHRRLYNTILFLRFFYHGLNFCKLRNFWEDSDGRAVPTQNGSLTRDIPSIGTLVGLLFLLCQRKLATIEQLMWPKPTTKLGLLPAHCSCGCARKLLLESTAPQCQLCCKLRFGVLVGHFPPSMIGV